MARVLIRGIYCLKNSSFLLSLPPFIHYYSSSSANISLPHQILSYFNHQCLQRSHLYQIHAQLITSGQLQNPFFGSKLLRLASQVADLQYTLWVFRSMSYPDIVCVNTVIKAYCSSSVPEKGVSFYFEMVKSGGFYPNSFTYPPLIGCCSKVSSDWMGEMCHGQSIKNGFDNVMQVENSLIHMYACCGVIEVALKVFENMLERDLVTWNSMLDGFVKTGDLRTAHSLFDVMPERNVVSWNVLMTGYLKGNNPGCVLKLFREMMRSGLSGNDTTMVNVIAACGRSARLKEGASVHGFCVRRLRNLSLIMKTSLIDMYSKCGKVEVARCIFDRLPVKSLVCSNAMILGHCLHGDPRDGLHLFEDMVSWMKLECENGVYEDVCFSGRKQVLPDEITYVGVLCACTRAKLLEEGRIHFHQMVNFFSIKPNFAHYWCMANLLASNGLVQEALETVRKVSEIVVDMSSESLVWASLLGASRFQGDVSLAAQVATALIELEPQNTMCYALLLNIYAAAGRWEDAAKVKDLMKKRMAGKVPSSSLVDLIEIVHNFRVEDGKQYGTEIVPMMDTLGLRLNVSDSHLEQPSVLKTESQT